MITCGCDDAAGPDAMDSGRRHRYACAAVLHGTNEVRILTSQSRFRLAQLHQTALAAPARSSPPAANIPPCPDRGPIFSGSCNPSLDRSCQLRLAGARTRYPAQEHANAAGDLHLLETAGC